MKMTILRSRFAVEGGLRFLSHLDTLKGVERALRRAGLPVAFSQGFNPHPQIAFGPARAVGLASRSEYFDVELTAAVTPEEFQRRLSAESPQGFQLLETREIPAGSPALMAILNCAHYEVRLQCSTPLSQGELDQKVTGLFQRDSIIVTRHSPKGSRQADIRTGIWSLSGEALPDEIRLEMEVRLGGDGNVRPGEVVESLGLSHCQIADMVRTGLFVRRLDGVKLDPWESL